MTLLVGMLAVLGVCVLLACSVGRRKRAQLGISHEASVVSVDVESGSGESGPHTLTLHDDEWGLKGRPDLLLEEKDGVVPVEWKRARVAPKELRPSHQVQLGTYFLLCEADPQVGQRPAYGEVQYLDHDGRIHLNGRFKVPNTDALRRQVLEIMRAMRHALQGHEAHRNHEIRAKCRTCSVKAGCGEALA